MLYICISLKINIYFEPLKPLNFTCIPKIFLIRDRDLHEIIIIFFSLAIGSQLIAQ